ncbi:ETX/MTX2 family pore-forming toxin [Rhizomonospora bruguierae]|uniref:ETX/MTX2 family pore-forming toxin n=1 Tax=Rhizomonospora bruguierae TaxID=1581705 RepID=UPI001BCFB5C7|nr:ETX/MTX2 family pore-forming toxin [Micromonospora sp. NBRC 107566]
MHLRKTVAVLGSILTGLGMTLAMAQPAAAQPYCDVPIPPPRCNPGEPEPPPPPTYAPVLAIDAAQQTTSRTGVRVRGWTADGDQPTTALTVQFTIDGAYAGSMVANGSRPDVAAAYPQYGAAHGYDITLAASATGHTVCVTAVSVGGGANTQRCTSVDTIVSFDPYRIDYDTAHAVLTSASLDQLDRVTTDNDTEVQQSTEISGSKTRTESKGWSDTQGVRISASTSFKVGVPIFAEGKVTVSAEGSFTFTQNGSVQTSQTWSWRQPVLVPPRSIVEVTVTVTSATITVPYTLSGDFVYASGARAAGTLGGMFAGGNSENLRVTLKQYNLDGTPTAAPVKQPQATLLKVERVR